jgi:hypothetical protein
MNLIFLSLQIQITAQQQAVCSYPVAVRPQARHILNKSKIRLLVSPENQTRSDARLAYFDSIVKSRKNFHVATGNHVYRLLLDMPQSSLPQVSADGVTAKGVEVSYS